jgi:hypothetical protein
MDADRFDRLSHLFAATGSRRAILWLGATALLEATTRGANARTRCLECERPTKRGRCRPTPDGTTCRDNPCFACVGGRCRERAADSPCAGSGRCLNGVCNQPPTCLPPGFRCPSDCCSGVCVIELGETTGSCGKGGTGTPCFAPDDCQSGSCVGYRCT